jgi:uncharacterized protein YmfQ (DUF2313 family)
MQEGKAARWADAITGHMLDRMFGYNIPVATVGTTPVTTVFTLYDWPQFWGLADQVFNPPNVQTDAAIKLDKLKQEKMSAKEFFIEFDVLAATAGYALAHFNSLKIHFANQHLNSALITNIHNINILPTTWEAYKK